MKEPMPPAPCTLFDPIDRRFIVIPSDASVPFEREENNPYGRYFRRIQLPKSVETRRGSSLRLE
jgi:hypothetical protein